MVIQEKKTMKHTGLPDSYFEKYSTLPVKIVPYNPQIKKLGLDYLKKLQDILATENPEMEIGGSTALQMEGKGDLEINIYCTGKNWKIVYKKLFAIYESIGNEMEEYVRFNDVYYTTAIEIIITKGKTAYIQKSVLHYIETHPEIWEAYRQLKREFRYSEREYNRHKNRFFENIVAHIPDPT